MKTRRTKKLLLLLADLMFVCALLLLVAPQLTAKTEAATNVTIYYYPQNGTSTIKKTTSGTTFGTLPNNPSKTGYTFGGWYMDSVTSGTKIDSETKLPQGKSVINVYAKWTANTYTTFFNVNGGDGSIPSRSQTYGSNYSLPSGPTRNGYSFTGWYTAASGGNQITTSNTYSMISNQTLYAHWSVKTITVSFNANGGSCGTASKNVTFGSNYGDLPAASRPGYTFAGWYTAASGGSVVGSGSVMSYNFNITLYAHWSPAVYTIYFNANGGSTSTSSKNVTYGSTYGTLPIPTRAGYDFVGWFTATSGGTPISETLTVQIT